MKWLLTFCFLSAQGLECRSQPAPRPVCEAAAKTFDGIECWVERRA